MNSLPHLLGFLATVVFVYLGLQYYLAFWALRFFPLLPVSPNWVRCGVLLLALSFPASLWLTRVHDGPAAAGLAYASLLYAGVSIIALFCFLLADLAWGAARLAGAPGRLQPVLAWTAVAATLLLSAYGRWCAARPPAVRTVEVRLARLPPGLDGFSIAQVSDVHLGLTTPLRKFEQIAGLVQALRPDLIVFTGDMLDHGFGERFRCEALATALSAPQGKLAVLGNHEFYLGVAEAEDFFRGCGVRLLRNELVDLPNGLQVAGVDDLRSSGLRPEEVAGLLAKLDPERPALLLSHQPWMAELAAEKGVGLMLSGHTHRGQIFPFHLFVRMAYRYFYGLYKVDGMALYVTSGAGYWGPPLRLFSPAEVVKIVLRPGPFPGR